MTRIFEGLYFTNCFVYVKHIGVDDIINSMQKNYKTTSNILEIFSSNNVSICAFYTAAFPSSQLKEKTIFASTTIFESIRIASAAPNTKQYRIRLPNYTTELAASIGFSHLYVVYRVSTMYVYMCTPHSRPSKLNKISPINQSQRKDSNRRPNRIVKIGARWRAQRCKNTYTKSLRKNYLAGRRHVADAFARTSKKSSLILSKSAPNMEFETEHGSL